MAETSEKREPEFIGTLTGHRDWVTSICVAPVSSGTGQNYTVLSSSRDKKVMVWRYKPNTAYRRGPYDAGYPVKALTGHSQPIQDMCLSASGTYALTGSWDKTMRLYELETGECLRTFKGHTSDVNSVALSPDNRQIISGSRDKTIKLWNTMADCKFTTEDPKNHSDSVSCVRFSPGDNILIVSCGWDKAVKVWELANLNLKVNLLGHTAPLYTLTVSPDGSLCASGGKDGVAMLWDVNEAKHLYSMSTSGAINALCFSPSNYWLCTAVDDSIKIWDLQNKKVLHSLKKPSECDLVGAGGEESKGGNKCAASIPWCTSLAWSEKGNELFVGSSDGNIYIYDFEKIMES